MGGTAIISPQRASGPTVPQGGRAVKRNIWLSAVNGGEGGGGEGGSGGGLSPCFPLGVIIEIDPV